MHTYGIPVVFTLKPFISVRDKTIVYTFGKNHIYVCVIFSLGQNCSMVGVKPVETCSLTLYNINKTVVLTCTSINCVGILLKISVSCFWYRYSYFIYVELFSKTVGCELWQVGSSWQGLVHCKHMERVKVAHPRLTFGCFIRGCCHGNAYFKAHEG